MAPGPPEGSEPFTWDQAPEEQFPRPGSTPPQPFRGILTKASNCPPRSMGPSPQRPKSRVPRRWRHPWLLIGAGGAALLLVGVGDSDGHKVFHGRRWPGSRYSGLSKSLSLLRPRSIPSSLHHAGCAFRSTHAAGHEPRGSAQGRPRGRIKKDFAKAVSLYQELVSRGGGLNSEAAASLGQARASLQKQQAENERNEKFIKDYQYALKAYKEGDFAECLRVAWRLIYPDDTLAKQLGKRDGAARLIRDGYYNWAVMDLKSENVRGRTRTSET